MTFWERVRDSLKNNLKVMSVPTQPQFILSVESKAEEEFQFTESLNF
jgi:hypothetical protein